jgi:ERCC4-type nuclease
MLIIDSREASKHKDIINFLKNHNITYQIDTLEVGDFLIQGIEKNLVIERKTLSDFLGSMKDGRLWEQLKALSNAEGYAPFLIIEGTYIFDPALKKPIAFGTYLKKYSSIELSFYSAIYACASFNVKLLLTKDVTGTALLLRHLSDKLGMPKEKKEYPLRSGFKKDWSLQKKRLYLFECFGVQMALALKGKTLKQLLKSPLTREELRERLPKTYPSGKQIPSKEIDEILDVLGFDEKSK